MWLICVVDMCGCSRSMVMKQEHALAVLQDIAEQCFWCFVLIVAYTGDGALDCCTCWLGQYSKAPQHCG